jgi:energy-coupling factor transport system permease protein
MVSIFLLDTITQMAIAFVASLVLIAVGRISIIRVIKGLKPIFVLLVFTFVFQILFNQTGQPLVTLDMGLSLSSILLLVAWTVIWRLAARMKRFGILLFLLYVAGGLAILVYGNVWLGFSSFSLTVYEDGVVMSLFVVLRLLIIIMFSTILTISTRPTDLTQALEKLLRPLRAVGIRSEDFALIISISLRYIPTILDEANKIMLAQASRGADFSEGKLKDKITQIVSLLVPMFIIAFKRSEDLADAMESRNFVPGKPRTRVYELSFAARDAIASVLVLLVFAAAIIVKVAL